MCGNCSDGEARLCVQPKVFPRRCDTLSQSPSEILNASLGFGREVLLMCGYSMGSDENDVGVLSKEIGNHGNKDSS